jgi:hypothetical protein
VAIRKGNGRDIVTIAFDEAAGANGPRSARELDVRINGGLRGVGGRLSNRT